MHPIHKCIFASAVYLLIADAAGGPDNKTALSADAQEVQANNSHDSSDAEEDKVQAVQIDTSGNLKQVGVHNQDKAHSSHMEDEDELKLEADEDDLPRDSTSGSEALLDGRASMSSIHSKLIRREEDTDVDTNEDASYLFFRRRRRTCPFADWQDWGACMKNGKVITCGGPGVSQRWRQIKNKGRRFKGCDALDTNRFNENKTCGEGCCPVNCVWNDWSEFGKCSKECGTGSQQRTRAIKTKASCNGDECKGDTSETRACNTNPCPVDCKMSDWTEWGSCSLSCGPGGTRSRLRHPLQTALFSGQACPKKQESQACPQVFKCPVDCAWDEWEEWSECDLECWPEDLSAAGTKKRTRTHKHRASKANPAGKIPAGKQCHGHEEETKECNRIPCTTTTTPPLVKNVAYLPYLSLCTLLGMLALLHIQLE
eukprot:gnl/TRDRNA2_/TRDRNA2_62128_c0_seq1.p1 gnl/TRDRNA2_/TRDRNA2_62128_c0~~gnl/TRDRNA2_/TRDRNA2_62128_c0_seq1.p1  ORF type:complete len:427 (+),score=58.70 gnl/TRDRNA2_/TRDRNA2_62128_c0_seq1:65-1345(+)